MSPISGFGPSIYQYLQAAGSSGQPSKVGGASKAKQSSQTEGLQDIDGDGGGSNPIASGYQPYNNGVGALFKLIQAAVSSSLQTAQSSGGATSPNQVVQSAIAQIVKNQPGGGSDAGGADGIDGGAAGTQGAFTQLLQSNGVNAQQFQQDFLQAVQSAQNGGSTDAGSALASLPTGSLVDVLA